jgi:hypothetical protein
MSDYTKCEKCDKTEKFVPAGWHCSDCLHLQMLDSNPKSRYMILACNINTNDNWIWKYLKKEHNFIPVFDDSQGNCFYYRDEIEKVFKTAQEWENLGKKKEILRFGF